MNGNPLIPEDFIRYLELNGFRQVQILDNCIALNDSRHTVEFKGDKATFYTYYDGSMDEAAEFTEYASVEGISQLDDIKFMMLCHCFDLVPLRECKRRAWAEERAIA